jgi:excinuclease ABC subunit C
MVGKIARLETTVVRSEAEALLLENNLIKSWRPSTTSCFGTTRATPTSDHRRGAPPDGRRAARRLPRMAYYRGAVDKRTATSALPQRLGGQGDHPAAAEGVSPAHLRGHGVRQPHAPCLLYQIKRCTAPAWA